jgi:hypothetical protein
VQHPVPLQLTTDNQHILFTTFRFTQPADRQKGLYSFKLLKKNDVENLGTYSKVGRGVDGIDAMA